MTESGPFRINRSRRNRFTKTGFFRSVVPAAPESGLANSQRPAQKTHLKVRPDLTLTPH